MTRGVDFACWCSYKVLVVWLWCSSMRTIDTAAASECPSSPSCWCGPWKPHVHVMKACDPEQRGWQLWLSLCVAMRKVLEELEKRGVACQCEEEEEEEMEVWSCRDVTVKARRREADVGVGG